MADEIKKNDVQQRRGDNHKLGTLEDKFREGLGGNKGIYEFRQALPSNPRRANKARRKVL